MVIKPGVLEIDLVVHCGESAMGEFINTLNATESITFWYEAEAIMGKSQRAIVNCGRKFCGKLREGLGTKERKETTGFIPLNSTEYIGNPAAKLLSYFISIVYPIASSHCRISTDN